MSQEISRDLSLDIYLEINIFYDGLSIVIIIIQFILFVDCESKTKRVKISKKNDL